MASPETPRQSTAMRRTFHGTSSIRRYEVITKLGEGTFGEVHKARDTKTGQFVALKKILMHNEKDGFPITALREIKLLKMLSHVNVLKLNEMAVERNRAERGKKAILYMATPYMDHDLSGLLDNPDVKFTEPQIKCYMLQLLEGLRYLHASQILHRDMKAANLLINNKGLLQIADFGLARHYDLQPRDYTALVVTRWYRPPELLLGLRQYTPAIDMWGAGCVFGEMFKRKPILAGNSDVNQMQIICDLVGSPTEDNMPGFSKLPGCEGVRTFAPRTGNLPLIYKEMGLSDTAIDFIASLLKLDWRKRLTAQDALQHPYFKQHPLPARPEDLPTFADSHELDRRNARGQQAVLPPAPAGGTVGMGPNGEWAPNSGPAPPHGAPAWATNGDGSRGMRGGGDRGPPGAHNRPPPGYRPVDDRRGEPPPRRDGRDRDDRYYRDRNRGPPPHAPDPPAYGYGHGHGHGHGHGSGLPPRPPPAVDMQHRYRERDRERDGGGRGRAKDTFIPEYSNARRDRDERDRRSWEPDDRNGRRRSRDEDLDYGGGGGYGRGTRDRSRSPRPRAWERGDREGYRR